MRTRTSGKDRLTELPRWLPMNKPSGSVERTRKSVGITKRGWLAGRRRAFVAGKPPQVKSSPCRPNGLPRLVPQMLKNNLPLPKNGNLAPHPGRLRGGRFSGDPGRHLTSQKDAREGSIMAGTREAPLAATFAAALAGTTHGLFRPTQSRPERPIQPMPVAQPPGPTLTTRTMPVRLKPDLRC